MYRRQPGTAWSFSPPHSLHHHHHPPGIWGRRFWGPTLESLGTGGGGHGDPVRALARNSSPAPGKCCAAAPPRGCPPVPARRGGTQGLPPPGRLPGIKPASVSLPAAKPRALAALQRSRARGDVGGGEGMSEAQPFLPCSPPSSSGNPPEPKEPPRRMRRSPLYPSHPINPYKQGTEEAGGRAPPGHSWMASR